MGLRRVVVIARGVAVAKLGHQGGAPVARPQQRGSGHSRVTCVPAGGKALVSIWLPDSGCRKLYFSLFLIFFEFILPLSALLIGCSVWVSVRVAPLVARGPVWRGRRKFNAYRESNLWICGTLPGESTAADDAFSITQARGLARVVARGRGPASIAGAEKVQGIITAEGSTSCPPDPLV